MKFFFTIDAEDWFQVENLREAINPSEWDFCRIRAVDNIKIILDLLENKSARATFFVLGWIAEKAPKIIKEIYDRGHEVASHGYAHKLISLQSKKEFRCDLKKSKILLEDIIGNKIDGYRAPNFSITEWAIDILKEEGFIYDSSYCPASFHNRYGKLNIKNKKNSNIFQFPCGLIEIIVPIIRFVKFPIPWGGGAYFRFIPYSIFKFGIKRIISQNQIYTFYFHPWEIDYNQPRIKDIKLNYKIRHYYGLKGAYNKLEKLLEDFQFTSIRDYLKSENILS